MFRQEMERAFGSEKNSGMWDEMMRLGTDDKEPAVRPKSLNTMAKEYMLRAAYGSRDSWRREEMAKGRR